MEGRRTIKAGGEKNMSLDDYLGFFSDNAIASYTIPFLNQILQIHGFRKLHKANKKTLSDVVEALDLLNLSRSTLKQNLDSSPTDLTLDDVKIDIEALKWQECSLTSLHTIYAEKPTHAVAKPIQKRHKRKRASKEKAMKSTTVDDDLRTNEIANITGVPDKSGNTKKKKKKKKKMKQILVVSTTDLETTKPTSSPSPSEIPNKG